MIVGEKGWRIVEPHAVVVLIQNCKLELCNWCRAQLSRDATHVSTVWIVGRTVGSQLLVE